MKLRVVLLTALPILALSLTGCAEAPEYVRAKQLLTEFTCPGGLSKDTNGNWAIAMKIDVEKAQGFVRQYEKGLHGFSMPIDEVVETVLRQYRVACEGSKEAPLG